jgi:hypothetical protein
MFKQFLIVTLLWATMSCTSENKQENVDFVLQVERVIHLPDVPSGSALALVQDTVYILGDDSPFLFQVPPPYEKAIRHLLLPQFAKLGRIPKDQKPDFESFAEAQYKGENHLFAFGSGSKSPERDFLLAINPRKPRQREIYSLNRFYDRLFAENEPERANLNIEGAFVADQHLYLFNRGNNSVIRTDWPDFLRYVTGSKPIEDLELEIFMVALPEIDGLEARFSGACLIPEEDTILFTATVEETDNWIDDGEILGSFVGLLPLRDLQNGSDLQAVLLRDAAGNIAKDKVESIAFRRADANRNLLAFAVTDNDDGTSKLLELRIVRPFPRK